MPKQNVCYLVWSVAG